jgi:ribosomal-protein-alanine N-acetyltransferase
MAVPATTIAAAVVILSTERLLLRRLQPADLESLYTLYRDPEVRKYFPDGTRTQQQTKEEIEWFVRGDPDHPELGLWATIDRHTGEFLGRCGLLPWHIEGAFEVELAFMIKKERWRQGLATEAARGIIRHASEILHMRRLVCLIMPGNAASSGVAKKVGMKFERELTAEFGPCHLHALDL